MSETRSSMLLSVLKRLRRDRRLRRDELGLTGVGDVEGLTGLLVEAGLALRTGDGVSATEAVDGAVNVEKLGLIEEYVLGQAEATDFRRLMDFLLGAADGQRKPQVEGGEQQADPETLRKYVREFIDPKDSGGGGEAG